MMSLFSSFDIYFSPFAFFSMIMMLLMWLNPTFKINLFLLLKSSLEQGLAVFFYSLKAKMVGKIFMNFTLSIVFMVAMMNFFSVLPFNLALCSQMSMVLLFSTLSWLAINTFHLVFNFKGFVSHCVPDGTPLYLTWLLFVIELVSNLIRPLTLTVRLVANILAGHLLMILLSNLALYSAVGSLFYLLLNIVEFFVALIQSYIFMTMVNLYHSDME